MSSDSPLGEKQPLEKILESAGGLGILPCQMCGLQVLGPPAGPRGGLGQVFSTFLDLGFLFCKMDLLLPFLLVGAPRDSVIKRAISYACVC